MNVPLIRMRRDVARRQLRSYAASRISGVREEYNTARRMLEALAEGTPVLQLSEVFAAAPLDDKGRPRLAVARSDRAHVAFRHRGWNGDTWTFHADRSNNGPTPFGVDLEIRGSGPLRAFQKLGRLVPEGFALVPMVPPHVARGHALAKCVTLWEVEAWADRPIDRRPDRDPYLLQRLAPDLYAVVGEWDLTEVERAVMAGRLSPNA